MRNDDIPVGKAIGCVVVLIIILTIVGFATDWLGLVNDRYRQRYQEESRTETYHNSRGYQQGTQNDIVRYCEQMRDTTRPMSSRKAVAALIRTTAATYDGPLTPDDQDCISEAKGF